MLLARACHIVTAEFGLIPLKSGELSYIIRRMDRDGDRKLHMEDFCQILNKVTAQKYNGSMEQIGRALREYSDVAGLDAIRLFELTVFCFLTGNSDMHLKNFSLMRRENGTVELSPAYDLVSPGKRGLRPVGPYSLTRHGWFRVPPIDQYPLLLPPVGVWSVSQYQCGGPSSQIP